MHPFGPGGACGAGLFRARPYEDLLARTRLPTLIRWNEPALVDVLTQGLTRNVGYRVIYDDLVLKATLTAHLQSDLGDHWAAFEIEPERPYAIDTLADRFGEDSPFVGGSATRRCHAHAPTGTDRDAYERLRSLMWGDEVAADFARMHPLSRAYALTLDQLDAVGWYTSPQQGWRGGAVPKTDEDAAGQRDVVRGLTAAMRHLPSTGDLGVRVVSFRVVGGDAPSIAGLDPGTRILHGVRRMLNGSHHFMSTSIRPNVKGFSANLAKRGEVLAICGTSGRYIQWLGRHGRSMDGDEVLYPPGTVTEFVGRVGQLSVRRKSVPLFLLFERDPTDFASTATTVDDLAFEAPPADLDLPGLRATYATTGRCIDREEL